MDADGERTGSTHTQHVQQAERRRRLLAPLPSAPHGSAARARRLRAPPRAPTRARAAAARTCCIWREPTLSTPTMKMALYVSMYSTSFEP